MKKLFSRFSKLTVFGAGFLVFSQSAFAQAAPEKPKDAAPLNSEQKPVEPPNAAQIELLETKYRFESNGDSRKEVHALVKINSELGVRQFARLNFDYNRGFQSVEIPLVHITHANGGTSDILPSAITDAPNPAAEKFPAYHDVRVKSVRILGLQPSDSLEYRVITTTTNAPLAPDFWLDHSFDRTGVVSREIFQLEVPTALQLQPRVNPDTPPTSSSNEGKGDDSKLTYVWKRESAASEKSLTETESNKSDISLSTFKSWDQLAEKLGALLFPTKEEFSSMREKAFPISKGIVDGETLEYYRFVSQKIQTVELPLGATGYRQRKPMEILESGYATAEDKFVLYAAMGFTRAGFVCGSTGPIETELPSPSRFDYLLTFGHQVGMSYWLDLNTEVAPIGMIPGRLLDKTIFVVDDHRKARWEAFKYQPVYPASQRVIVSAALDKDGRLATKIKYILRANTELLLRVTFHKTPPEKQKDVAQYLALSDGFRGKVTSVKTSDPYDTDKPFEVEYELTQEKFVDWSKKPVRIPALLPLPGLPEAPRKSAGDARIDLGPPLNIELTGTLRLPPGTTAQAPPGTSAKRDYATFVSEYCSKGNVLSFSRHLNFLTSELPRARAVDLSAFLHAVQSDQSQLFVLDKPDSVAAVKPK